MAILLNLVKNIRMLLIKSIYTIQIVLQKTRCGSFILFISRIMLACSCHALLPHFYPCGYHGIVVSYCKNVAFNYLISAGKMSRKLWLLSYLLLLCKNLYISTT